MEKFEYKMVTIPKPDEIIDWKRQNSIEGMGKISNLLEKETNELVVQGWEFMGITPFWWSTTAGMPTVLILTFRKKI